MSSDKSYLARVQSMPRYYGSGLYRELSTKNVFLFAQAIAFKVLVTIVPIVILLMGVLGDILGQQEPFATVSRFVRGFLPPYESQQLLDFLGAFQGSSGAFLSIGTVGLVLTAMTLATTVRLAVASAFEQDWNKERTLFGGYAFDLRMVAQVGLLFLLTVALSFAAQALNAEGLELMNRLGLQRWLRTGWRNTYDALALGVPLLVSAAMFFQLFYFIPLPHPPRSSALLGASITALLWEAAKYGFAFYATSVGTFNYQSASDGMAALTGGFGLLIAFVLWVYYSGIVLMVGAVVASLHEQRRRARRDTSAVPGSKLDAAAHQRPTEGTSTPGVRPTEGTSTPGVRPTEGRAEGHARGASTPGVRPDDGASTLRGRRGLLGKRLDVEQGATLEARPGKETPAKPVEERSSPGDAPPPARERDEEQASGPENSTPAANGEADEPTVPAENEASASPAQEPSRRQGT